MQYGATFRSLRRSKGLTLKQVADDVNSISLISQFEHDQLHISTERFIHLLDRIAVSFDEFQVIRTGTAKSVSEQQIEAYLNLIRYSYDRLSHPYDHEAIDQRLTMLERQNEKRYSLQLDHFLQIRHGYAHFGHPPYLSGIAYYLQNVDQWGLHEMRLFKQSARLFPLAVNRQFIDNVKRRSALLAAIPGYQRELFYVYFTATTAYITQTHFAEAAQCLNLAQREAKKAELADISIFLPFMAGWLKLFEGAESEAATLFDQTLTLYHQLGMKHHETVWQDVRRSEIAHYKANEPSDFFVFDGI